jgi:dTDP-4-amino-4,6-dideoxygalactose transaminase
MQINVTKTYLPEFEEYILLLKQTWERGWVTNNGVFVKELETRLKEFLGVKHLFFVSNGTAGLEIAIKAMELKGKVITTPFSYVATTSSLYWLSCQPIFADIDVNTFCIDTNSISSKISKNTQAILATHVFGNPCDMERIDEVAKKNNLKVIYDAAHAFGVKYKGSSVLNYGDISVLSFHATKIFHTVEGGALITSDDEIAHKISYMRNFGHKGEEDFWGCGINAKNSEFHAAMGLCILPKITDIINDRKAQYILYKSILNGAPIQWQKIHEKVLYNYSYCPVVFRDEKTLLRVKGKLNQEEIFPRRYFYPSLNKLNYLKIQKVPIAENIAERILCLPSYYGLQKKEIEQICGIIKSEL